jgi:hypothetical protein
MTPLPASPTSPTERPAVVLAVWSLATLPDHAMAAVRCHIGEITVLSR